MLGGCEQQVVVVPEQAIRNTADAKARKRFCQELEERFVVLIIGEDARFLVAAGIHVMQQTGRMQTQWTAHSVRWGKTAARRVVGENVSESVAELSAGCRNCVPLEHATFHWINTPPHALERGQTCKKQDLTPLASVSRRAFSEGRRRMLAGRIVVGFCPEAELPGARSNSRAGGLNRTRRHAHWGL